jgi:hypothetical protein
MKFLNKIGNGQRTNMAIVIRDTIYDDSILERA